MKNIVFDIGNVLLEWAPNKIAARHFPGKDPEVIGENLFHSQHWLDLNRGKITEEELIKIYHVKYAISKEKLAEIMQDVKESLVPIQGSFELVRSLLKAGYTLYCITDNVKEIMTFIKQRYDIWECFTGIVVSAEIGILKPNIEIFNHLLNTYKLKANECLFIDDIKKNVDGARKAGIQAIQFVDIIQCKNELRKYEVNF